ncbi:MAG: M24 family metallopeptidase, partial [Patescibacteria group bacterium]
MIAKKHIEKEALVAGGKLLGEILARLVGEVRVGITTRELDALAEQWIREVGGVPSFKGYQSEGDKHPYPATVCISVNEEVVHGIPSERALKNGDIVGLDIGMKYKGFFTDTAVTVPVGTVPKEVTQLLRDTADALEAGIQAAVVGNRIGDI